MSVISTISYDQSVIIKDILKLYINDVTFDLDVTYSKGNFYKANGLVQPRFKSDLYPQTPDTLKSNANNLPLPNGIIKSLMFDPPFLAGYTKPKPTGKMGERFHGFRYIKDLWEWYDQCLIEHHRLLIDKGWLVFKCQDTVSSGKQHLSHVHIINEAEKVGFYCKDIFILLAKSRLIGHNHSNQKHARKFHSYFLVFQKL